jgi:hypothetical protein
MDGASRISSPLSTVLLLCFYSGSHRVGTGHLGTFGTVGGVGGGTSPVRGIALFSRHFLSEDGSQSNRWADQIGSALPVYGTEG